MWASATCAKIFNGEVLNAAGHVICLVKKANKKLKISSESFAVAKRSMKAEVRMQLLENIFSTNTQCSQLAPWLSG